MTHPSRVRLSLAAVAVAGITLFAPTAVQAQDGGKTYTLAEVETKPSIASLVSFQRLVSEGYPEDL